ncbi:cytochrome b562 [Paraglaciecola sp. 2405UD69-4]|uniref:cytochrome b562 n=1 Tax=Paraglaciecola sp. 2405UD69-4 TaxID=3391836 RepID=UPI0039C96E8B
MLLLKKLSLILVVAFASLSLGSQVFAQNNGENVTASTDVEATMKSMALAYKQAMVATKPSVMESKIVKLKQLVASVQLVKFESDRQEILQQGLTEVQAQLDLVQVSLTSGDMTTAKQQLEKVDALKKRYHKKRSPSIWELIFGSD